MQQERHVVAPHVQVALIYIRHMWQGIEILNLWSIGVVHDRAILAVRNSENFFQRLALCVLDNGVVKFLAADEINPEQSFRDFSGKTLTCGPTNPTLIFGLASLIFWTSWMSPGKPGVLVNKTRNS